MVKKESAYWELMSKLSLFIRRYYYNKAIAYGILLIGLFVFALLILLVFESFIFLKPSIKTSLVVSLFAGLFFSLIPFVFYPLGQSLNFFKRMQAIEAAKIIGDHFNSVGDKLINAIQLGQDMDKNDSELLIASINQKSLEIKPINFLYAIDLSTTKTWLKITGILFSTILLCTSFSSSFRRSASRIYNYNKTYEAPSPFQFIWLNKKPFTYQKEILPIRTKTVGSAIPQEVDIHIDGHTFKMRKIGVDTFEYILQKVNDDFNFNFQAGRYKSEKFSIRILKIPRIILSELQLNFPSYTGLTPKKIKQIGQIEVPEGTHASWKIKTQNANKIEVKFLNELQILAQKKDSVSFNMEILHDLNFWFRALDFNQIKIDSIGYQFKRIKDQAPKIEVREYTDKNNKEFIHTAGILQDDYGLGKLLFGIKKNGQTKWIKINKEGQGTTQTFKHSFNYEDLNISLGESFSVFYRIYDNDQINGAKYTDSDRIEIKRMSEVELENQVENRQKKIERSFGQSDTETDQLNKKLENVKRNLFQKKLDWETKNNLETILEKHQKNLSKIEEIGQEMVKKNLEERTLDQLDEDLKQRHQELNEESKALINQETKKLIEEIKKLLQENKTDQLQQKLNMLSESNQEIKEQLERLKELYKELELEKLARQTSDKLEKLAKKQLELSKKKSSVSDQKEIEKKFEDIKRRLKEIEKQNETLKKPKKLKNTENSEKNIDQALQKANQNLQKNNINNAKENQKNAGDEMKQLSVEINDMMMDANQQQYQEDYTSLRKTLENLLQLSFDQEKLLLQFKEIRNYQQQLAQNQKRIEQDFQLVKDSLQALSTRVPEINKIVKGKIKTIEHEMRQAKIKMSAKNLIYVPIHQQVVMMEMNNLANLIQDILSNMQEQMKALGKAKSQGKPSMACKKPGQGKNKKSGAQVKQMQQELKNQLLKLHEGMQKGLKPGTKNFAEAAQMQAQIREKLSKLRKQSQKIGNVQLGNQIKQTEKLMDEIERNLLNKTLNATLINKIKKIESRLLAHQKAKQKQEQDQQRQGKEGNKISTSSPRELEDFLEETKNSKENLQYISPDWSPYYKNKVDKYLKIINQ